MEQEKAAAEYLLRLYRGRVECLLMLFWRRMARRRTEVREMRGWVQVEAVPGRVGCALSRVPVMAAWARQGLWEA